MRNSFKLKFPFKFSIIIQEINQMIPNLIKFFQAALDYIRICIFCEWQFFPSTFRPTKNTKNLVQCLLSPKNWPTHFYPKIKGGVSAKFGQIWIDFWASFSTLDKKWYIFGRKNFICYILCLSYFVWTYTKTFIHKLLNAKYKILEKFIYILNSSIWRNYTSCWSG